MGYGCNFAQLTPHNSVREFSVTGISVLKWLCSPDGMEGKKEMLKGRNTDKVKKLE